jgi:hypothetical protein
MERFDACSDSAAHERCRWSRHVVAKCAMIEAMVNRPRIGGASTSTVGVEAAALQRDAREPTTSRTACVFRHVHMGREFCRRSRMLHATMSELALHGRVHAFVRPLGNEPHCSAVIESRQPMSSPKPLGCNG